MDLGMGQRILHVIDGIIVDLSQLLIEVDAVNLQECDAGQMLSHKPDQRRPALLLNHQDARHGRPSVC